MKSAKLVMLIEDEFLLKDAIKNKLEKMGVDVADFTEAQPALDFLNTSKRLPAVIWLDYYLPNMSGLDMVIKLRENPNLSKIPIVVVSNSASDEKVKIMLGLGVKDYVLKASAKLDDIIETVLNV